jgi:XTP/dITP diphosphohydrolase
MQNKKETILLATRNMHKVEEIKAILKDYFFNILTLNDVPPLPEVEEDGNTFTANAQKKALQTARLSGYLTMADDSGLVVEALNGQPGVFSARFAGVDADDDKNNAKLLNLLRDVPQEQRTARFVCVIALANPEGIITTVEGSCAGKIALEPYGQGGFGYDPLFIPVGYKKSFAELAPEEKNRISHRGQALVKFKDAVKILFAKTSRISEIREEDGRC